MKDPALSVASPFLSERYLFDFVLREGVKRLVLIIFATLINFFIAVL